MERVMRRMNRMGLFTVLALQGAALGLVAQEAHATGGSWNFTTVDSTAGGVNGASAAILSPSGYAMPLYTRVASGNLFKAKDTNFHSNNCGMGDSFSILSVDTSDATCGSPSAVVGASGTTWLGYTDGSGNVLASGSTTGPVQGTTIYDKNCAATSSAQGVASVAEYGGNGYVFYAMSDGAIRYNYFDSSTSQWHPTTGSCAEGLTLAGGSGTTLETPTAAVYQSKLWVFYHDVTNNCLAGSVYDGTSWHVTQAPGFPSNNCIDGGGGSEFQVSAHVGQFPATLVDSTDNLLYVFYYDSTNNFLRASSNAGGPTSIWEGGDIVDSSVTMSGSGPMIAPVWNTEPQVFYIDSNAQTMRHTTRGTLAAGWPSTTTVTDGSGCTTGCGSTHHMAGPISAVMRLDCGGSMVTTYQPHVFYHDATDDVLREGYYAANP